MTMKKRKVPLAIPIRILEHPDLYWKIQKKMDELSVNQQQFGIRAFSLMVASDVDAGPLAELTEEQRNLVYDLVKLFRKNPDAHYALRPLVDMLSGEPARK